MAVLTNSQVEALARQLLQEQIDRSSWFLGLAAEARATAITADVEQWWHLKAGEAARILIRQITEQCGTHSLAPVAPAA